ncbi:MAG: UDP-N-acetylmuramoyl-L-alanine--D-glutamate ligase [Chloroflexi bacterium]|nr:UDP-N-acetylmuramoyl-L-alanine--D-glutamate ligase [Chloroflexota bacterium]MCY3582223.1 UDP-N-acetylmuramoyl-L-alanine--D-glutamate ligase [Chloroflexota bacterium]MCY3715037.1 UDP-N-acetylmuramoyl-L-alanine--D-glutamate ligase [Chloroflexota bacterium]MDE2650563.1 UDP-N-acetylmuramoyl-L-alanine--D-glutamate ligase [Chloroflexota bacterium]MXV92488.1 UDP-N-acetylmuramoyl-L-alanine--D-glutamate ligase [Chloroflexota bacterium]
MSRRDRLAGKRVVVFGFGRQGRALARWLPSIGADVVVTDSRSALELAVRRRDWPGVRFYLGGHPSDALIGARLICVSAGVPLDLPLLDEAREQGIPFSNDAQLFLERCPVPVIGITGSAGKTTTTALVAAILRQAGYTTWLGGNIGNPLLEDLAKINPRDIVVMELSSFQLELMQRSPQVAAILNLTPNHLDRHGSLENYAAAKANILRYQNRSDVAVLCQDDKGSQPFVPLVAGEDLRFSRYEIVADGAFTLGSRLLVLGAASYDGAAHVVCQRGEIALRGEHNVANVLAACAITGGMGLATGRPGIAPAVMRAAIRDFRPVAHRLEVLRVQHGVSWVNDSIATAPERLLAALNSFQEPLVLLIGGADKDLPWAVALQVATKKAKHIIVFGAEGGKQVATKVMPLLQRMSLRPGQVLRAEGLAEAVECAAGVALAGDVVLLSPGGTSYDAYADFAERGNHFRQLVSQL